MTLDDLATKARAALASTAAHPFDSGVSDEAATFYAAASPGVVLALVSVAQAARRVGTDGVWTRSEDWRALRAALAALAAPGLAELELEAASRIERLSLDLGACQADRDAWKARAEAAERMVETQREMLAFDATTGTVQLADLADARARLEVSEAISLGRARALTAVIEQLDAARKAAP